MSFIDDWNRALVDTILPLELNERQPVIFACDDESIRLAGDRLGLVGTEAVRSLVDACRDHFDITRRTGLGGVVASIDAFRRETPPRQPPTWLSLSALAVLAACRMNREGDIVTHDYYTRLLGLFDLPALDEHPPLRGFGLLEPLWLEFAQWLADDEEGKRGLLVLPQHPVHRHVSPPISQTLFRARDRVLLGRFFARHQANLDAGWNILIALRNWPGRVGMTRHAQELLHDSELSALVTSALRAAYKSWDGSLEEDEGRRSWPGRMRLAASPRRVTLYLSSQRFVEGATLEGPDGPFSLPPYPSEAEVPFAWLSRLAQGRVLMALRGEDREREQALLVMGGSTLLFEPCEEGLLQVQAGREKPLWVLSMEPGFHAPTFDDCRYPRGLVPSGWTLLAALEPSRLPQPLLEAERPDRPDLELVGGLRLADWVYLVGAPPAIQAGELDAPLMLRLDGRSIGAISRGERIELPMSEEGVHRVDAGIVSLDFEIARRGLREGVGQLRWHLDQPALYRNGATDWAETVYPIFGRHVCGAALDGVERPVRSVPLLLRTTAPVLVLDRDGVLHGHSRPQPQGWLRRVGLPDGPARWALPDPEHAEWVLVNGRLPHVLRVGRGSVEPSPALSALLHRYQGAAVQTLWGDADTARRDWRALCDATLAAASEEDDG